ESVAETSGPVGGVPVSVATFVNEFCTFASEHWYVTDAPGAIEARAGMSALVLAQFGASGSVTWTFVSVTLPVFVTTIVQTAEPPVSRVWPFGFFVIAIAGLLAGGGVTGGVVGGGGATQSLIASALSPACPSAVARVMVCPPTVTVVVAWIVVSPA